MKNSLLVIFFISLFFPHRAFSDIDEYYIAYSECSKVAKNQTMQMCNYAKVVENYYNACMNERGFGNPSENMKGQIYAEYLENYKKCSVVANSAAQTDCSYAVVYKNFYNSCMAKYGIYNDENSQPRDTKPSKKVLPAIPSQPTNSDGENRNSTGKFFDGLM